MNPVRAKIVKYPEDYRWSSCCKKIYLKKDSILDLDSYYLQLGSTPQERANAYKKWFQEEVTQEEQNYIKERIKRSIPIGSKNFVSKICRILGKDIKIRAQGRPGKEK